VLKTCIFGGLIMHTNTRPVQDPFEITDAQESFAENVLYEYHRKHAEHFLSTKTILRLTEAEELEKEIMGYIKGAKASINWAKKGDRDSHWDAVSINDISCLWSLGFKTNEDIQKYLDSRILPAQMKDIVQSYKGSSLIAIQCINEDNFYLTYGFLISNRFTAKKGVGAFCLEVTGIDYDDDESSVTWADLVEWVWQRGGEFL
jgi:hypothetical protein